MKVELVFYCKTFRLSCGKIEQSNSNNKVAVKKIDRVHLVKAIKQFQDIPPGVNFTNLLAQSANEPVDILQRRSVSPTKLCQISPLCSTRKYAQLLCCTPCAVCP